MNYHGKRIILHPGQYAVSSERTAFRTLLGSCVAACLWDESTGIAGMNHFLLANRRYAQHVPLSQTEAGKYGLHAMELLINGMLKVGAQRSSIKAKVFGGASLFWPDSKDNFLCVGEVNSRFILEFLKTDGIPILAADLGGDTARVIHFMSDDFTVYVRKIRKSSQKQVLQQERSLWKTSLALQKGETAEPELWL
ncbi:MAG TPA: chemotaxis protein CheD [Deltaproteobacteria bacterium]|nr:chemotaxis protein CheD [Deltaproteobacteria bacterium]